MADFQYDPIDGWNNTSNYPDGFPDYPAANVVRPMFQKLFDQIRDAFNTHKSETVSKVVYITEPYGQLTKTTVNLGFRPKLVNIISIISGTKYESIGFADATQQCVKAHGVASDVEYANPDIIIDFVYDGVNILSGTLAITDTGIEITWNLTGALNGASGVRSLIISTTTH